MKQCCVEGTVGRVVYSCCHIEGGRGSGHFKEPRLGSVLFLGSQKQGVICKVSGLV